MKFLLLSDLHSTTRNPIGRTDNVFEAFNEKFTFVLEYAKKHKCTILQAGDLSDSSRNWDILDYLMTKLSEYNLKIYTVFGQHDMFNRSNPMDTPSNMLTLIKSGFLKPLTSTPYIIDDVCLYGSDWKGKIPKPFIKNRLKNVLVIHAPISKRAEWHGHDFTNPRYFLNKNKFDLILVGDVHKKFIVNLGEKLIVNTGPILRLESNLYNFKHKPCFYIWNSKTGNIKEIIIPHKQAEYALTRDHIDEKKISKDELEAFTSSLKNIKSMRNMKQYKIKKYLKKHIQNLRVRRIVLEIING